MDKFLQRGGVLVVKLLNISKLNRCQYDLFVLAPVFLSIEMAFEGICGI